MNVKKNKKLYKLGLSFQKIAKYLSTKAYLMIGLKIDSD